jgi:REP element-mobilizing transposase RayT
MRLKGYDYSKAGLYFITICVQNHESMFGEIQTSKMILNDAGKMIEKWYFEIENKYPDIFCREMVVMPNHFHCILETTGEHPEKQRDAHVGTPLRGRPYINEFGGPDINEFGPPVEKTKYGPDNKKYGASIGEIIDWFKTMTTNEYIRGVKNFNWKRFNGKLWQRNYWDRIVRDETAYQMIAKYIENNPSLWKCDNLNTYRTD